jgi:hypothetical protein
LIKGIFSTVRLGGWPDILRKKIMKVEIKYFVDEKTGITYIVWKDGTIQPLSSIPCGVSFIPENVLKQGCFTSD